MKRLSVPIRGKNNLEIAILGPGAVGGFLAVLFSSNGFSVSCVAKEDSAQIIAEEGIKLESKTFGNLVAKPRVVEKLDVMPDILFITTKATGLKEALKKIDNNLVKNSLIVPLLNGIEHMEVLRANFGNRVIAANIGKVELKRSKVNCIKHTTKSALIELSSNNKDIVLLRLNELKEALEKIGLEVQILDREVDVFWSKLVRLNAIACTTSATNRSLGFIRSDNYWKDMLRKCVNEAARVASAEGVKIDPQNVMHQIESLPETLGTSMQRDIHAGRPSELDAIAGAVVRVGIRHGIDCPTIKEIISIIQFQQKERGMQYA